MVQVANCNCTSPAEPQSSHNFGMGKRKNKHVRSRFREIFGQTKAGKIRENTANTDSVYQEPEEQLTIRRAQEKQAEKTQATTRRWAFWDESDDDE